MVDQKTNRKYLNTNSSQVTPITTWEEQNEKESQAWAEAHVIVTFVAFFCTVCSQIFGKEKEIDRSHVTCLFASLTVGAVKRHEQDTLQADKGQLSPCCLFFKSIARGTTDPEIDSATWTKFGNNMGTTCFS